MEIKDYGKQICALSLATSCGCNLNCGYCQLKKNEKSLKQSLELQKSTIQALQDGTFLSNTKKVLDKLGTSYDNITVLSFWGQEPSLTFKYFNDNIQEWLNTFKNVERLEFSTNAQANGEEITRLIKLVDQYNHGNETFIHFQCSYDGKYSTQTIRKANIDNIKNTIATAIEELNNTILNHTTVELVCHCVVSEDIMRYLDTNDKLYAYYQELDEFWKDFPIMNHNPRVAVADHVSQSIEAPYQASAEDGILFANFIERSRAINRDKFFSLHNHSIDLLHMMVLSKDENIIETLRKISEHDKNNQIDKCLFCGNNTTELKLLYDGTLLNCQTHMLDLDGGNIEDDGTFETQVRRSLSSHHYFCNPLVDSDEEILRNFHLFDVMKNSSFYFNFNQIVNFIVLLAREGQVKKEYLIDHEKLLRHAYTLTILNCCSYNNIITTASNICRDIGYIRLYCNGVLDLVDEFQRIKDSEVKIF